MLQTIYKEFLTNPDISFLTDDVVLHHITTLITSSSPSAVIKHFKSTEVKRKKQEFIDIVEGPTSLAVIVNTTLEFVNGGGAFLPNLDDNFIVDRSVTLPITHFVSFSTNEKIRQIRLNWDQGSLLKLIDIIGKTGRNWPIRNGEDQIRMISSSVTPAVITDDVTGVQVHGQVNSKPTREKSTNAVRDPHASLSLFASRNQTSHEAYATSVYRDDRGSDIMSTEKKRDPAKFKHFEFTNGAPNVETKSPRILTKSSKHESHWNFDDFMTPQKNIPSKVLRSNDVRHWGNSDDEVLESPERIKKIDKPRRDIETHFELQDTTSDSEDHARIVSRFRGQGHNDGLSLYKDLFDEKNGSIVGPHKSTIPSLANVKDRRKDFEAHFTMSDRSPGTTPEERMSEGNIKDAKIGNSIGLAYGHSSQKENNLPTAIQIRGSHPGRPLAEATNTINKRHDTHKGIRTDGDGMGGKKGTDRSWGFGDNSDGEEEGGINRPGKYRTGKQTGKPQALGGDFWDF